MLDIPRPDKKEPKNDYPLIISTVVSSISFSLFYGLGAPWIIGLPIAIFFGVYPNMKMIQRENPPQNNVETRSGIHIVAAFLASSLTIIIVNILVVWALAWAISIFISMFAAKQLAGDYS